MCVWRIGVAKLCLETFTKTLDILLLSFLFIKQNFKIIPVYFEWRICKFLIILNIFNTYINVLKDILRMSTKRSQYSHNGGF